MSGKYLYKDLLKPVAGFVAALLLLVLTLPLQLLLVIVLFVYNRGEVFFIQTRIGYKEKPFRIYKFKTMRDVYGHNSELLPDENRQLLLGNILRLYHLDELPQFFNVLLGQLQMIGPRPLLQEYLPHYSQSQRLRHNCRPGIIGLAQVKGGNALSWTHRLRYDNFYARKCSFMLDMYILWLTVKYFFAKKPALQSPGLFSESLIDYKQRALIKKAS